MNLSATYVQRTQEWKEEGRKEGRKENSQEIATKLLRRGLSIEEIAEITELPTSTIAALQQQLAQESP